MIYPIRYYGDPILRRRASPVTTFDADLERLAADMLETMYAADGIGIAAPQIGVPLRLFVALEVTSDEDDPEDVDEGSTLERAGHDGPAADVPLTPDVALTPDVPLTPDEKRRAWGVVREHVIVNPVVVERSGGQHGRDGCLSLPGLTVDDVPRALSIVMEYQDLGGAKHSLAAEGYFAHVLQHEFDHLEGVLFFDHLPPARRDRFMDENRVQLAQWQREAKARLKTATESQPKYKVG